MQEAGTSIPGYDDRGAACGRRAAGQVAITLEGVGEVGSVPTLRLMAMLRLGAASASTRASFEGQLVPAELVSWARNAAAFSLSRGTWW